MPYALDMGGGCSKATEGISRLVMLLKMFKFKFRGPKNR